MRDYLVVTRGVDPVELERARMDYMTSGYDSGDNDTRLEVGCTLSGVLPGDSPTSRVLAPRTRGEVTD